jgi:low temperature requirement protein LtrA
MNGPSPAATGLLRRGSLHTDTDRRVMLVELFYDPVFVFAANQIAPQVHDEPSMAGVGQGVLVF